MAWTELDTDRICEQQAGYGYGIFTASGQIYAGQAVYIIDDNKVAVPTDGSQYCIGVAAYDAADGDEVTVHGPGCIVITNVSGSAGTAVGGIADGVWSSTATNKTAVIVEGYTGGVHGKGKILIL